jgi:hypothetical protein
MTSSTLSNSKPKKLQATRDSEIRLKFYIKSKPKKNNKVNSKSEIAQSHSSKTNSIFKNKYLVPLMTSRLISIAGPTTDFLRQASLKVLLHVATYLTISKLVPTLLQ